MRTYYRTNPETGEVERSSTPFHAEDARAPVFTDLFMDGHRTVDGVDIGSRSKRRAYMASTGTADASDFTETFRRGAEERARLRTGNHDDKALSEAVSRAWEKHT